MAFTCMYMYTLGLGPASDVVSHKAILPTSWSLTIIFTAHPYTKFDNSEGMLAHAFSSYTCILCMSSTSSP